MPSPRAGAATEHFITLFDRNFLPAGLCLHRSLMEQAPAFCLWVICMDQVVEARLRDLALPYVRLIPLHEIETEVLRAVKHDRTTAEYCWTMTPFAPEFVMSREAGVERVTYIDADLFFFGPPSLLLEELERSGSDVLITEHAYAPEYDQSATHGKYCVQFITFRNTPGGRAVLRWWRERCVEWCFARHEDGKFGDQKYLDDWPTRFPGKVHVLARKDRTLAPWNIAWFQERANGLEPVFFHFHGFRIISSSFMLWYLGYRVGRGADKYYERYTEMMSSALAEISRRWGDLPVFPEPGSWRRLARLLWNGMNGRIRLRRFHLAGELKS